jgi:Flp pilus assembly protein TadG
MTTATHSREGYLFPETTVIPFSPAPKRFCRTGAATLEFAVVAPLLFLLIFGLVEISRGFMVTHLLQDSARKGCRAGVVPGVTSAAIRQKVESILAAQGLKGATVIIKVNDTEGEVSNAASNDKITVVISIPVSEVTWVPGMEFLNGNLGAMYTLRRE